MAKFETIYKKAKADLDAKNPENHKQIYIRFIKLCESNFSNMPKTESVNVWHIGQNMYKPAHQGGRSIKDICAGEFSTLEAMY